MLGAATCSFINTEPGSLWELPACPLSASAADTWVRFAACAVCACLLDIDHIFGQQIMCFANVPACMNVNMWISVSWQVCVCMCVCVCCRKDEIPSLSLGTQGASHFKGPRCPPRQPARQGENPVYVSGPRLAGPVADTNAWRGHRLPPPMQVLNPELHCDATIQPSPSSEANMSELQRIIFLDGFGALI